MSSRRSASVKFWVIAVIALLGAGAGLATLWPRALAATRRESARLVTQAAGTGISEAAVDYRLATWLNSSNTAAYAGLARTEIATGQAGSALQHLARAGKGSEVEQLKVRTLIELGRSKNAAAEAPRLTTPGRGDVDLVLAGLAYALAGRPQDTASLISRVSSPEAAQSLRRAQSGSSTLAAELYATGLLESSRAILVKQPTSFERNLLLAHIYYLRHTKSALSTAADYATSAVALNPADLEARQLLIQIYQAQNLPANAADQQILLAKLQAGRP